VAGGGRAQGGDAGDAEATHRLFRQMGEGGKGRHVILHCNIISTPLFPLFTAIVFPFPSQEKGPEETAIACGCVEPYGRCEAADQLQSVRSFMVKIARRITSSSLVHAFERWLDQAYDAIRMRHVCADIARKISQRTTHGGASYKLNSVYP
jgi:hypothetical protein